MADILSSLATGGGLLSTIYKIIYGERAWNNMAPSTRKQLDYEDVINDENATVAYLRQREFQENYLTPQAQLNSMAAGFKDVGLNKMMLAGAQPGASSAAVPQASASGAGSPSMPSGIDAALGAILDYAVNKKRVDNDYKLRERGLEIEQERLNMMKPYYGSLNSFYAAKTTGVENENSIFSIRKEQAEQNVGLVKDQRKQLMQWIDESLTRMAVNNETADYIFKNATYVDVQAAGQAIQNQIFAAQAKYSDEYFKAVAGIQRAQAYLMTFESEAVKKYWSKKMQAYEATLKGMIAQGKQAEDWANSEAFKRMCGGKMTDAERTQFWGNLVGSVVKTGISAGAGIYGAGIMKGVFNPFPAPIAPVNPGMPTSQNWMP